MKTFKQYLAEAEQINYDKTNVTALRKQNVETAREILQNNKEIIQDINNAKDLSQFDTEEQRDAVVAAYILNKEQPEFAKQLGIDLQNPKFFEQQVKDDIIDPTRHYASENKKKNPSIEEIKSSGKEEPEEKETEQEAPQQKQEKPQETEAEPKSEPEDKADEPEEKETSQTQQDDEEDDSPIDQEDFPPPKKIAKQIETLKQETEKKIRESTPENPTQGQQRVIDSAVNELNKRLNNLIKVADKADRSYSVSPTPMSMRRGSTAAKKALNDAKATASNLASKAQRKQLDTGLARGAKRAAEIGKAAGEKVKKAAESRPAQIMKQQAGRALKQSGEAIKRGTEQAKAATQRVMGNIAQNTTAKMISNQLGTKPAQQYIEHLKNNEEEKAEALRQEALKRANKEGEEKRYEKMDQRTQDKALKQRAEGRGGSKAAAISKRVTDKFRGSSQRQAEREKEQA